MSSWTIERRLKQREAIQRWKPWTRSTGPKTEKGKFKSSKNALKTGDSSFIRLFIKELNKIFKKQKEMI